MNEVNQVEQKRTQSSFMRPGLLLCGDLIVFILFALGGREVHDISSTNLLVGILTTAAPFMMAWLAVAAGFRLYLPGAYASMKPAALRTAAAWLVAAPVAFVLRELYLGRGNPITFLLVAFFFNGFLLIMWRVLFARFGSGARR